MGWRKDEEMIGEVTEMRDGWRKEGGKEWREERRMYGGGGEEGGRGRGGRNGGKREGRMDGKRGGRGEEVMFAGPDVDGLTY